MTMQPVTRADLDAAMAMLQQQQADLFHYAASHAPPDTLIPKLLGGFFMLCVAAELVYVTVKLGSRQPAPPIRKWHFVYAVAFCIMGIGWGLAAFQMPPEYKEAVHWLLCGAAGSLAVSYALGLSETIRDITKSNEALIKLDAKRETITQRQDLAGVA